MTRKVFLCGTEHFLSNYFHKAPPTLHFLLFIFAVKILSFSQLCNLHILWRWWWWKKEKTQNGSSIVIIFFPSFFFFAFFFCSYFSIILLLSIHLLKKIMYIKAYLYMWMCHKFIIKVNEWSQNGWRMRGGWELTSQPAIHATFVILFYTLLCKRTHLLFH